MSKRAFITAATSSIGKALARKLSSEGFDLVLHFNTDKDTADKLAKELKATLVQADFTTQDSFNNLLKHLLKLERFDVLINNAAITSSQDDKDGYAWERVFLTNTITPALLMANASELINDNGVIINISSIYGDERFGDKEFTAYNASKAALNSVTRTFAKKLAPRVRVNAIAPGFVDSTWNEHLPSRERQRLASQQLTEKLVRPEQIADLAIHMIENDALDGEIIYLDGGQTLKTI